MNQRGKEMQIMKMQFPSAFEKIVREAKKKRKKIAKRRKKKEKNS